MYDKKEWCEFWMEEAEDAAMYGAPDIAVEKLVEAIRILKDEVFRGRSE